MSPGSRPRRASRRGINFHHYEKGWHPTATLGVFGATASCCHLMALDRANREALAIAASFASGIKANFGTMTKPLHVGHTSRNGLFAALLAREGFTANAAALEHKQGFLHVFNGAGNFDAEAILADWGGPTTSSPPGSRSRASVLRQHAPGGRCDAARCVREYAADVPDKVARIEFVDPSAPPRPYRPAGPANGLDAKFSVQYCLARALLDGRIVLEHFEGEAFRDPAMRALMRRIHAAPFPATPEGDARAARRRGADHVRRRRHCRETGRTRARARRRQSACPTKSCTRNSRTAPAARSRRPRSNRLRQALSRLDEVGSLRDLVAAMAPTGSR